MPEQREFGAAEYSAVVPTPQAARYLGQMCAHFGHKLPVTRDSDRGTITFDTGVCSMHAAGENLTLMLDCPDASKRSALQDVVARHLRRYAFREDLQIDWHEPKALSSKD